MILLLLPGNLLVETAAEDAEAESTRIDCFSPIADADPSNGNDKQAAAMAAAYRESIRIRPIDIIRVPLYDRVWQIGSIGQVRVS